MFNYNINNKNLGWNRFYIRTCIQMRNCDNYICRCCQQISLQHWLDELCNKTGTDPFSIEAFWSKTNILLPKYDKSDFNVPVAEYKKQYSIASTSVFTALFLKVSIADFITPIQLHRWIFQDFFLFSTKFCFFFLVCNQRYTAACRRIKNSTKTIQTLSKRPFLPGCE